MLKILHTALTVSIASRASLVEVSLACFERYGGGRGLPETVSPLTTDSPFPCR